MYEHKLQITMIPLIYFSDSKSLIVLYLLHSIFIPTSKKVTYYENGKKGFIKFSIKDSQNAFIIIKPTAVEMDATLKYV